SSRARTISKPKSPPAASASTKPRPAASSTDACRPKPNGALCEEIRDCRRSHVLLLAARSFWLLQLGSSPSLFAARHATVETIRKSRTPAPFELLVSLPRRRY